jgi:hypothetical protein
MPLQPGNSTTRIFKIKSRGILSLRPSMYRLNIEVEYELAGVKNIDTVEHTIQIRAAMLSMMFGAMLGGFLGTVAAGGMEAVTGVRALRKLVPSLVISAVSIVLFARKKDVQPIIAIEDFWGGLAIGFLIGYSGPRVLGSLLEPPKAGAT